MEKAKLQQLLVYIDEIEAAENSHKCKPSFRMFIKKLFCNEKSPSKKQLHELKLAKIKEIRKILYKELKYIKGE